MLFLGEWTGLSDSPLATVYEMAKKVTGDRGNLEDTTSTRPLRSTASEVSHVMTVSPGCAAIIRVRKFSGL